MPVQIRFYVKYKCINVRKEELATGYIALAAKYVVNNELPATNVNEVLMKLYNMHAIYDLQIEQVVSPSQKTIDEIENNPNFIRWIQ